MSVLLLAAAFSSLPVTVVVNGFPVSFDQPPVEQAGRVYVPLRGIFERLGASVVYANGTINATQGSHTIQLRIGARGADVNGVAQTLDAPPFIAGNRTLVPLRFIAQALGANVDYASSTRTVTVGSVFRAAVTTPTPVVITPVPRATPPPAPTRTPNRPNPPNFIAQLRPYYNQLVGAAFTVSGRTHADSNVRIDVVATGGLPGQRWERQGSSSMNLTADDRGFFSAAIAVGEFGFGVVDVHVVSVDPNTNSADVRSRSRFGR